MNTVEIRDNIKCYNGTTGTVTDIISPWEVQINYSMKIHVTDIKFINDIIVNEDQPVSINETCDKYKLIFFKPSGKYYTDEVFKVRKGTPYIQVINMIKEYPFHKDMYILITSDLFQPHLIRRIYRNVKL